ncbi:probable choline kinase 2 isoform X2 [Setaria italica]|uniref:probable choline kinase 2 isoform X2 n=1 Tax=Setaria italica TaxID=4555 RepID=UPI0006464665|nr:probable choline kinase 2 isoform X2 [Setaria italica]
MAPKESQQSPAEAAAPGPGPAPAARSIPEEARRLLRELAAAWEDVAGCGLEPEVVPLKGAMTNEVYQARWPAGGGGGEREERKVLVRVYGEGVEHFFDREDEVRTFECMSRHGHGPRLLGRFSNGRVEEFIHARTLSAADLRDPEISAIIASKLREFHNLDMPGPKSVLIWERLSTSSALGTGSKLPRACAPLMKPKSSAWIAWMRRSLHWRMNFQGKDYEYASFNPVAYDITNHFCEMAADYHSEKPHILDYTKYPDTNEQKQFVQTYLSSSGDKSDAEEVENLIKSIEKYTLASHLVWGLWGIISDHVNDIDFDYKEYARQRFEQYWLKKPTILTSQAAE